MSRVRKETIAAFNRFRRDQLSLRDMSQMTMVQFADAPHFVFAGLPLDAVADLDGESYKPRGSTSLLDAIGETISAAERAGSVRPVIVVQTDGEENASRKFSWRKVKAMISAKREQGWEFLFLGEHETAILWAAKIGFPLSHSATYETMDKFFQVISQKLLDFRAGASGSMALDAKSRKLLTA